MSKEPDRSVVVAVGGGKGGVGKTLLTSALARRLAEIGRDVVVIDADFARPSLLASVNGKERGISLADFLTGCNGSSGENANSPWGAITIIPGPDIFPDAASEGWRAEKLNREIKKLGGKYILLDLGPGTSAFTLDCFLAADIGVLVTAPDPLAERDCFHFAQSCLMQGLRNRSQRNPEVKKLLQFLEKRNGSDRVPLRQFMERFNNGVHLVASILEEIKSSIKTGIVINMTKDDKDHRDGATLRAVFGDYLGLDVELWGQIRFDWELRNRIRSQSEFPLQLTPDFEQYAQKLISLMRLTEFSGQREARGGRNGMMRLPQPRRSGYTVDVICSTKCVLWDECQHRRGGYPCRIKAIGHLKSLEGEQYLRTQKEMYIIY